MKKRKPMIYILDLFVIFAFTTYFLLDTFVIPRTYAYVKEDVSLSEEVASTETTIKQEEVTPTAAITNTSYSDENINITLEEYRYADTTIYVADVTLSSIDSLKTAFASQTYGKNVTAKTSEIADSVNAILAINGDYYGARNGGYVLRNGTWYRDSISSSDQEDLVIHTDGSFEIINEGSTSANEISDALQIFSFGPALINNGEIAVSMGDEVGRAMANNPRTAICVISPLHYLFVVADGRTSESVGLSLYDFATFLQQFNVEVAYNLDGGGSSTMVFNGNLVNNPTTNGNRIKERSVSDIVYIGQ